MPFVKIATVAEVPVGTAKQVALGKRKLALFNVGGVFYAIDDACPHKRAGTPIVFGSPVAVPLPTTGARRRSGVAQG
jgi:nitrite reductase/ring-hydroxylating ferredoxin subunit